MDKFISALSNWATSSPLVIFIVGTVNSVAAVGMAVPTAVALVQGVRSRPQSAALRVLFNTILTVTMVLAAVWSILSYAQGDHGLAIVVGVGAALLFVIAKGIPWLRHILKSRKSV